MKMSEHSSSRLFLIAAILVLFASVSLVSVPRTSVASSTASTGVIVPLYAYPGAMWQGLIQAKEAYPSVPIIAVINPENGPGTWQNPTILQGVRSLQAAGITVVGYVYTQYGARSISSVESDIVSYRSLYGLSGIFMDQMSNVHGYEWYYADLTSFTHSHGMWLSIGNPGTGTPSSFFSTADILVIYENAGLPSISLLASRTMGYSRSHFTMTPYAVGWISQSYVSEAAQYLGYMYITSGEYPSQYTALPSYFSSLLSYLSGTSGGDPGGVPLAIQTVSGSGSAIQGLYTVIRSTSGSVLGTGFSPVSYSATSGDTYEVSVSNYGSYVFSHWSNGETSNTITVTPTEATTLTAIYNAGSGGSTGGGNVPVTIDTTSMSGSPISGLYTVVRSSSGSVLETGFSPLSFEANSGTTYSISVSNYGSYYFNHWNTGSTSSTITITPTSATTLTAYYDPSSSSSSGTITVESATTSGSHFNGMYMVVRSTGGSVLKTGFTTLQFGASSGSTYVITASNYGSYIFSHWSTGSTSSTIDVSGSTTTLVAYYS